MIYSSMIPFDFTGRFLGRFRDWAHRTPPKPPSEISALHKVCRLVLALVVIAIIIAPALYLLS